MKKTGFTDGNTARKYVNILGISLNSTSYDSVLALVEGLIVRGQKFTVFTPNPEIVLMAGKDKELKRALEEADFLIPDGIGLKIAEPSLKIIKGRKLFLDLVNLADEKSWRVFFLGGLDDEAEAASSKLQMTNDKLQIQASRGPKLDKNAAPISEREAKIQIDTIRKINKFKPDLLFVGFGAPKQEKWIYKNAKKLNAKCIMAVGGTFSYFAGYAKLPPVWMEKIGFEWLWRVFREPKRIKRIISAVVIFPLKILCSKLWQKRA